MNLRSGKARRLVAAPLAGLVLLSLAACQTNVGAAATLKGSAISEKSVDSYVTPTTKKVTYSSGLSVSPRTFVLQALLQEKVLSQLFQDTGGTPSQADLAGVESTALQGSTEDAFSKQIIGLGLPAKLEPHLLRTQELAVLLAKRFPSQAQQQAQVTKFGSLVSVSPRYGQWNPVTLGLTEFGKNQVPGVVTYTSPLPGDVKPTTAP